MNKEILRYAEHKQYNEQGDLIYSVNTSGNNISISGAGDYFEFNTPSTISTPLVNTYTTSSYVISPETYDYTKYTSFPPIPQPLENQTEDEYRRKELVELTKMNILKEILDEFDKCEDIISVYKIIDELNLEYKKLAGIKE